jgi:hypothetical protein
MNRTRYELLVMLSEGVDDTPAQRERALALLAGFRFTALEEACLAKTGKACP